MEIGGNWVLTCKLQGIAGQRAVYMGFVEKKRWEKGNGHVAGNKNKGDSTATH